MWISPTRLLDVAEDLAGATAGPGRPRDVALRRAVSTAYYAVFHRLSYDTIRTVLGHDLATDEDLYAATRLVSHGGLTTGCERIGGGHSPPPGVRPVFDRLRGHREIVDTAQSFLALRENRERADYDHLASFGRRSAVLLVRRARTACAVAFANRDSNEWRTFHGVIALTMSVQKR